MTILTQSWPRAKMTPASFYKRLKANDAAESKRCGNKIEVYVAGELVSVYYLREESLHFQPAPSPEAGTLPEERTPAYEPPQIVLPEFKEPPAPVCRTDLDFKATFDRESEKKMTKPAGPLGQPLCTCGRTMVLKMNTGDRRWFWSCPGYPDACQGSRPFQPRQEDLDLCAGSWEHALMLSLQHFLGKDFGLTVEDLPEEEIERRRRVRSYKVTDRTLAALALISIKRVDRSGFCQSFWPNSKGSPAYVSQLISRGFVNETSNALRLSIAGEAVISKAMEEGKL